MLIKSGDKIEVTHKGGAKTKAFILQDFDTEKPSETVKIRGIGKVGTKKEIGAEYELSNDEITIVKIEEEQSNAS